VTELGVVCRSIGPAKISGNSVSDSLSERLSQRMGTSERFMWLETIVMFNPIDSAAYPLILAFALLCDNYLDLPVRGTK
jgi:hypothetical protein